MRAKGVCTVLVLILAFLQKCRAQLVRCDMPADVVFLLDASASIKAHEWEQEKEFVGILINSLAVEPHAINVGIIVYSTEIGQVVDLQPFKSRLQLQGELPKLIQTSQTPSARAQWTGREMCSGRVRPVDPASFVTAMKCTDTALAIARMREMMQNQGRLNATHIAVVITDGRSDNVTSTIQQAIYARQLDKITMIALGVGNETFVEELSEIAKSDLFPQQKRLFQVTDFAQLQGVVNELRNLICEAISCQRAAEVVFLLDGSHSIKQEDWSRNRLFISTLINSLEVDISAIHVGIIVYSSNIGDTISLDPFLSKTQLLSRVGALNQPPLGRTNTALGLQTLRAMFRNYGRPDVPRIGIVITDGKSTGVSYLQTMEEARLAKTQDGIVMFVVGVGEDTMQVELEAMATSRATLFNVMDFSALINIAEALRNRICSAIVSTPTPSITSTTPTTPGIPALCRECLEEGGVGYNAHPSDCTKYVTCYPEDGGGYQAVIKDCPFGLYWSSDAVSCVDAVYVTCPNDPCQGQPEGRGHTKGTSRCGEYWTCRRGRSVPHCCPAGHRYSSFMGCVRDSSCPADSCSLQWTLAASDACPYRPNPADAFSFLEVVPGKGHVTHPCRPGTAYEHKQCACVYSPSSMGCDSSLHYLFDGTFDDQSHYRHPARVERVLLRPSGTAYFNGTGRIEVNTLPADHFSDNFEVRVRYRLQPGTPPEFQWNDHYQWGFQDWYSTHDTRLNMTFTGGQPMNMPDPDQQKVTLEQLTILSNGTVIHPDAGGQTGGGWPGSGMSGSFVTKVFLGGMGNVTETAVSGGVVYVPNNKGHILVLNPATTPGTNGRWQVVAKDGTVVKSGAGEVPTTVTKQFNFQLRPQPVTSWFIIHTPTGGILKNGTGTIPESIRNLYSGLGSQGKILTVGRIGDETIEWTISDSDGSGSSTGKGQVPAALQQRLNVGDLLSPAGGSVRRWAILSSSGQILDSGTGDIPVDILNKHKKMRTGLVLRHGTSNWRLGRIDGTPVVEGVGTLPESMTSFIKGSLVLPTIVQTSTWTVVLPNGTRVSGEGQVPDHIQALFEKAGGTSGTSDQSQKQARWYVTDGTGTVLESGFGSVPRGTMDKYRTTTSSKLTVLNPQRTWEIRDKDGKVVARGKGEPPAEVFKVVQNQQSPGGGSTRNVNPTITSGANYPGYNFNPGTPQTSLNRRPGQPIGPIDRTQRRWTVTLPDGTQRSGEGEIPADIQALLNAPGGVNGGQTRRRWTVTLPDGSQRSGEGEVPADVQALLNAQGGSTKVQQTQRRWTVTLPDGSQKSGMGEVPADIQALLNAQRNSGGVQRRWTVTMPDGSTRSGVGEVPANIQALLNAQESSGGVQTQRRWTVTMPDGSTRSGVGEVPANIQALLDAQRSSGGVQTQRRWTVTMPDGSTRSGTGDVPANLQALLNAQTSGGVKTERRWTVTMPDGSVRSGVGEPPANIKALLSGAQGQTASGGVRRGWTVNMPDGAQTSGQGPIPRDVNVLLDRFRAEGNAGTSGRIRRAAAGKYQDLLGNCGTIGTQTPSFLLQATDGHVRLTLRTTGSRQGTSLTLPTTPGMNDVKFVYNGNTLKGISNGVQKTVSLKGRLLPVEASLTVGQCSAGSNSFRGEIDEVSSATNNPTK
ncbi:hypothetical protein BaRGS_00001171 [Batillaria attramentaria]|uniref:Uncharacterized protein n=1 Tax=Batillaria attramentaria TaxID=370345 RepID=A0ABD0M6F6_9CAEN